MAILNDLIVTGPSRQLGPVNMSSELAVQGDTQILGEFYAAATAEVGGTLTVGDDSYFSGMVHLCNDVYTDDFTTGALHLNGSNIQSVNGIYFRDTQDTTGKGGIHFYKNDTSAHSLYATTAGTLIYETDRTLGNSGTTVLSLSNTGVLATRSLVISATNGGTTTASITSAGAVTAVSYNATSDKRLKENIIDYKLPTAKSILKLPIKKFDFIDGPKNQIGCIAQDLQEICPELVQSNDNGYLSIQEHKLVYLVIDELKKLRNEFDEYKKSHP